MNVAAGLARYLRSHGAPDADWVVSPLEGGAVARKIERISVGDLHFVRKWAAPDEIAGLEAAQAVRPAATAIPELIDSGRDASGPWFITPLFAGDPSTALPSDVTDSLARLHVHFLNRVDDVPGVRVIDAEWWGGLCEGWILPQISSLTARHGSEVERRAVALVRRCIGNPAIDDLVSAIRPTLLHGDVHAGNVIVGPSGGHLIDWGSTRFGSPILDIANVHDVDSPEFARYLNQWRAASGSDLDARQIELGFRVAALQIPLQYLPWSLENRPTAFIDDALDRIDAALADV